jgi:peroxidase
MARRLLLLPALLVAAALAGGAGAQLSAGFYSSTCPTVESVVRQAMSQAVTNNTRTGAAMLRLFFHDCFVNVSVSLSDRQCLLIRHAFI